MMVASAGMQRHCRPASFGIGKSDESDEEVEEGGCITGSTSSASSLPRPRASYEDLRRRRKLETVARSAVATARILPGACATELTTAASSQEECLSEISLTSPTGDGSFDGSIECGEEPQAGDGGAGGCGGGAANLTPGTTSEDQDEDEFEVDEEEDMPLEVQAVATSAAVQGGDLYETEEFEDESILAEATPELKVEVGISSAGDELALANEIIASLKAEKMQLSARLRTVTQERNTLLQQRGDLEDDNERLREDGTLKDERLASLLRQRAASRA
mmetsp:Transcript_48954/g.140515  ORF Transcript_48954/g.140515 Transcript_48954/m.140515 type:complete len:276 (+) Transcript_48954:371-1198(+)